MLFARSRGACPVAGGSVKNLSLLICTASAFSERYLGMPLRDDNRYQVRVYRLPSLCLPPISGKSLSDTPTVKPLRMPLSKSEAAVPLFFCLFFIFFTCVFSRSVGFGLSSLFGSGVRSACQITFREIHPPLLNPPFVSHSCVETASCADKRLSSRKRLILMLLFTSLQLCVSCMEYEI